MDVYISEDYVRSRYKRKISMQNRDGQNDIKVVDEKKVIPPDDKNIAGSSRSSVEDCSKFKEDILFKNFTP